MGETILLGSVHARTNFNFVRTQKTFWRFIEMAPLLKLKGGIWKEILRNGPLPLHWNSYSIGFPKSFAIIVQIFSDKTASLLNGLA